MRDFGYKGKFTLLLSLGIFISFFCTVSPRADDAGLLKQIANNTYNALFYLYYITIPDSTKSYKDTPTPTLQSDLGNIIQQMVTNETTLTSKSLLSQINSTLLGSSSAKDFQDKSGVDPDEISISTMFGVPPSDTKSGLAKKVKAYVQNISGMGFSHDKPGVNWQGGNDSQKKYNEYFNTVSSVATYNNFILNDLALAYNNNFSLTTLQNTLISFATNSNQLPYQISQEPIGLVIRQMLLFQSQMYIMYTQMLKVQRQLLHTQAMTNTLLIINSGSTEGVYKAQAQGTLPGKES